jgi:HPt (histidine-containing phosphotransfer) domain-containing protein
LLLAWIGGAPAATPVDEKADTTSQQTNADSLIDKKGALARLGGNHDMYRHLLDRFRQDQADGVARIRAALASGDRDTARRFAHTLKGLAGNIGAGDLAHSALEVEQGIAGNDAGELIMVKLAQLESDLGRIFAVIDERPAPALVEIPRVEVSLDAANDSLATGLHNLYTLLQTDDADATRCLEEMAPALSQHLTAEELERLNRLVTHYEFEAATELLHGVAGNLGIIL